MGLSILILIGLMLVTLGLMILIIIIIVKKNYEKLYVNCTETTIGIFSGTSERLGLNDVNDMKSYYPIYKYIVNSKEYYCKGNQGAYNSKDVNTKNNIIYYNPNNPVEAYTDRRIMDFVVKIFNVLGWVFFGIGLCLIILEIFVLK